MNFVSKIKTLSISLLLSQIVLLGGFLYSQNTLATEIAGVKIPDTIQIDNETLLLNGVGIRTKFFFDIYIGSLYVKNKDSNSERIINSPQSKRINLNFLYKEVDKEKLTNGWITGFKNNNSAEVFTTLKKRLDKFNSYFITMHRGDNIQLDFLSSNNTRITINNKLKGEISGTDFQKALLRVWLGDDPADYNLKEALLGLSED